MGHRPLRLLHVLVLVAAMLPGAATAASPSAAPAVAPSVPAVEPVPFVVALDPGHGGTADNDHPEKLWDPGTISASGVMEKDLTLDVARRVRALLRQDLVQVLMTRDSDIYVDISPRMAMANAAGAGIFVSIHFNGFTDPSVGGSVVLYPIDADIPFAQTMSDALNHRLAALGFSDNGILAKDDLWVHAQMPAVTVEGGYLTNAADVVRLSDPSTRDTLAAAIRDGIETQAPEIQARKAAIIAWQAAHPPMSALGTTVRLLPQHAAAHLTRWGWLEGGLALVVGLTLFYRRSLGAMAGALAMGDGRVARRRRGRAARVRQRDLAARPVPGRSTWVSRSRGYGPRARTRV